MTNNGLYIHVPFCLSKCIYCDFVSFACCEDKFEQYVNALCNEIKSYRQKCDGKIFDTVYMGGGTPSVLPTFLIRKIADTVKQTFCIDKNAEWTIETNPATVDLQKAQDLLQMGFNRVSVGMQSADDKTLKFLGRAHNKQQFEDTINIFKQAGFENINADFILGLPGQTKQVIKETANYLNDLGVKHISAYSLIVEKGTPLSKMIKQGKIVLPDDDFTVDLYDTFVQEVQKLGFDRYEVSNFAKEGYNSRHNENCWKYKEYLGVGLNSQSFMFGKRFANVKTLDKYIQKANDGKSVVSWSQKLTKDDKMFEYIMLGLRLCQGLDVKNFKTLFGIDFFEKYHNIIEKLENQNLVEMQGDYFRVRPEKFYILNSVITEFID